MRSTSINSRQTANIGGAQTQGVRQTKRAQKVDKTAAAKVSSIMSRQELNQLKERPKLIAELSDSHRAVSHLMIAIEKLKIIARDLVEIKTIAAQQNDSPALMNQVDRHKKSILNAVNYQAFGQYVLDSSFFPAQEAESGIKFKIPGLNLTRERLTNELVTVYVNNRMVPFAFDRTATDKELFQQFGLMLAYSEMGLEQSKDKEKTLLISMPDKYWRKWDLSIHISGQGGRYPEGSPISIKAEPLVPTVELVTMLDLKATDALSTLDLVIGRVNDMHKVCIHLLRQQNDKADHLIDFCHSVPENVGTQIKQQFESFPIRALQSIQRHYVGPTRENVVSLIKK